MRIIQREKIADFPIRMECSACSEPLVLIAARMEEGFNMPSHTLIEFVADTASINLDDLLGQKIKLVFKVPDGPERVENGPREREYTAICTSVRYVGNMDGAHHFAAELRPTLWFLSLRKNCRIFQEQSARDIIKELLQEHGVDVDDKLTDTFPTRTICVQYRESDLDFIHRLMEEEGIHYFFCNENGKETLTLHDDSTAHDDVPCTPEIAFMNVEDPSRLHREHIYRWHKAQQATSGKYTHTDYNFQKPTADLLAFREIAKGTHSLNEMEIYDYPGHYGDADDGERYARIRMEERAIRHRVWQAAAVASNIEVGRVFKIADHEATPEGDEFVVRQATHTFVLNQRELDLLDVSGFPEGSLREEMADGDPYGVQFTAIPKAERYRPEPVTPWPVIAGVQTAVVTGPDGEEIHTDEYGRIRIQFHWDRLGEKNEHSTCDVRCMMPWVGKNWGMIAIPRMGQEVVVQFEEGNPDRPLVVGMVYNDDNKPPYDLPANKTQSGVKTMSSLEGTTSTFNELRFEDKKGAEEVYFHAEKDYKQVVENNSVTEIGLEKGKAGEDDKGDMTLEVWHDQTVTIGNDQTTKIGFGDGGKKKGDRAVEVYNDHKETVGHDQTVEVGFGNKGPGSQELKIKKDRKTTIGMNDKMTVEKGNYTVDVSLGKITMTAMQSIELKVGGNSVKIDQSGVAIKGIMVKINGDAMIKAEAPMTKVSGSGMLILQGGLVKIN